MSETIIRRERRARKTRCCSLCGEDIAPGERYVHNVILGRDGAYDWDVHLHCDAIVERYLMAFDKEEYDRDNVEEWARDEICSECDELQTACECSPLSCPRALRSLLPPSLQTHEDRRQGMKSIEAIRKLPKLTIVQEGMDGGWAEVHLGASRRKRVATVVFSWGGGWDHVSVSFDCKTPSWSDMVEIKCMFF